MSYYITQIYGCQHAHVTLHTCAFNVTKTTILHRYRSSFTVKEVETTGQAGTQSLQKSSKIY